METNCSKFWLGLGLGSIIGFVACHFSHSSKGKMLKRKACQTFHQMSDQAEEILDSAKDKITETGSKVTEKIAEETEVVKNKVHKFANNAKI